MQQARVSTPDGYQSDPFISKLFDKIEFSNDCFFLTGKAGTGKSTFLNFFANRTRKNVVVLAYTGIASLNVGGSTIHSFFKLPIKPLLPHDPEIPILSAKSPARKLIEKLDTVIIDEISMVRADVMEAIDHSLRINGGQPDKPWGGKQLILIGDLFQLPPVVRRGDPVESVVFSEVYDSPYFFSSHTYRITPFEYIEFQTIYRQSDDVFKGLLNKIRVGDAGFYELKSLNERTFPNYEPRDQDFVLTLVTTNQTANDININRLQRIEKPERVFQASIEGDFSPDRYPTDVFLTLKEGAQVIFIKNDSYKRWVNGSIGKVTAINEESIDVILENGDTHEIVRENWENTRYKWDKMRKRISSEVVGLFVQLPIKLAWAITIHKSQGLTFDKVVLDMGRGAFTHGQTYVALSRCKSLKGLALRKNLRREDVIIDEQVVDFYRSRFIDNQQLTYKLKIAGLFARFPSFFGELVSLHYPFTGSQLQRWGDWLVWGSLFQASVIPQSRRVINGSVGLSYNYAINWSQLSLSVTRFTDHPELAYHPKSLFATLPLKFETELQLRIDQRVAVCGQQNVDEIIDIQLQVKPLLDDYQQICKPMEYEALYDLIAQNRFSQGLLANRSFWETNFKPWVDEETLGHVFTYLSDLERWFSDLEKADESDQ